MNAFEQLCAEFKISSADFRQKLDPSKGTGATKYYTTHTTLFSPPHENEKIKRIRNRG